MICVSVGDLETRCFTLLSGGGAPNLPADPPEGLADVLTLQRPSVPSSSRDAERGCTRTRWPSTAGRGTWRDSQQPH